MSAGEVSSGPRLQPCAGGIVLDESHRILLVRRGQEPSKGRWSVPGGRCLPGEPAAVACRREVLEETGLDVEVRSHAGQVRRRAPDGGVYVIDDFVCRAVGGVLRAGDDAVDARWFTRADIEAVELAEGLLAALTEWGVLPD